jgi:hypothetical protein
MACGTQFDAFRVATEYLGPDLYRRAHFSSPLMNVVKEGTFPKGVGVTPSVFTIEPNEPATLNTGGSAITNSTGTDAGRVSGACAYSFTNLSIGFTEEVYSPKRLQYRGPLFCKDEQYFHNDADRFLNAYVEEMTKYVQFDWEYFLFHYYARKVPIYVASSTFGNALGAASTSLTAAAATSELTQEMLDKLVGLLIANRSTPDSSDGVGWVEYGPSGPLWTLQIGTEATNRIKVNNSTLRTDLNYGDPTKLLARLGATEAIKNFRHLPIVLPWRFTHDGAKYNVVSPFTSGAATKGTKTSISATWLNPSTAPYEAALVMNPNVLEIEHVMPDTSVGGATWESSPRMGEWVWKTGQEAVAEADGDACYDPMHKFGRHFGEVTAAPKPGANPSAGAIIFFKRCPLTVTTVGCT